MTAVERNFSSKSLLNRSLSEQMGMTDREIAFRKKILNLSLRHEKILNKVSDHINQNKAFLVEQFYDQQTKIEEIELLIGDSDTLIRLQGSMVQYIQSLFDGIYGSEYVSSRLRIGLVHKRIGVPPKLYLCGIQTLNEILENTICSYYKGKDKEDEKTLVLAALNRLLAFDVGLVFDTYIRSLTAEVEIGKDRIEKHAAELEDIIKERTKELEEQARHDPLTGLHNQRTFYEHLNTTLSMAKRYNHSVSLVYMDLDGFKKLNDSEGHVAGDRVLKHLAHAINNCLRDTDFAARYGGDEFCVTMPNTNIKDAYKFCERLHKKFAENVNNNELSLSCGIVQSGPDQHYDGQTLIKMADRNMYKAKETMGYCIVMDEVMEEEKTTSKEDGELEVVKDNKANIKIAN